MMSSLWPVVNVNIGIPTCGVVSATSSAVAVIPEVDASSANRGAFGFGERSCSRTVA